MYREWSIADGPADKKVIVAGQTHPFTVLRPDGTPWRVLIDITNVHTVKGYVRTFTGRLHYNREIIDVEVSYNTRDLTGHCHTDATTS